MYDIFGDRDIDNAVDNNARNEQSWHDQADAAWNFWNDLRNLKSDFASLWECRADNLANALGSLVNDTKSNYEKIGMARSVDNDCWIAARALQYHVTTQTVYTSRDDALRHVLKLLHTIDKTIDEDADVKACKDVIEASIMGKLGPDKVKELLQEKKFLELPDEVDI